MPTNRRTDAGTDSPRRLVINADDFGLSAEVNRGIMEVHAAGALASTSMMVNAPGFDDAVRLARGAAATLGVGLHLNLIAGAPLMRVPTLTDARTGRFHSLSDLTRRALAGLVDAADVTAECTAQLVRLRGAGIVVTHLDSHRHAHALPGIWRPVVETALRLDVPVVRVPLEPLRVNPQDWRATLKKAVLHGAWRVAARGAPPPPRRVDRFYGISLQGGTHFLPRLLRLLDALPPGTAELMVHPGYRGGELAAWDGYTWEREREVTALTSPAVRARLGRGDIELTHFGRL